MNNQTLLPQFETLTATNKNFAEELDHKTRQTFCQNSCYQTTQKSILNQIQNNKNIAFCEEHQAKMYHFFQNSDYPKGVYRVASANLYRAGIPDWQILFSVADFDTILKDDIYLSSIQHCEEAPHRVLLELSTKGADLCYIIEFDLQIQAIVEDGFHFPLGKNHISWQSVDSVFICPAWDERQCTLSGYSREVWHLQRGQKFTDATPIFQADKNIMQVTAWRYLDTQGQNTDLLCVEQDFYRKEFFIIQTDYTLTPFPIPKTAELCGLIGGYFIILLKDTWTRANQSYAADSLLAIKFNKGKLGQATVLFHAATMQNIECVETSRNFLLIHYLDHVISHLCAWKLEKGLWQQYSAPQFEALNIELIDQPFGGDIFYLLADDLIHTPILYAWNALLDELYVIRRQADAFNKQDLHLKQFFATSADGTQIPYFWCGKTHDSNTVTLVYVYGGFGVNELPHYLAHIGQHWLENGHAFVIANIRGGGEGGVFWHTSAQKKYKQTSIDDLNAVISDLHAKGYSSPPFTALQGGSNGGLIVCTFMNQYPEKICAVIAEVPLTDMLRFHCLGAGNSWIAEYGNPDNEDDFPHLQALSPIHNIKKGVHYPNLLITTNLYDDRVHPAHALKLYTQMQKMDHCNTFLYLNKTGGHTGNSTQEEMAHELACMLSFLSSSLKNTHIENQDSCANSNFALQ